MSGPTKAKLFEVMRLGPVWELANSSEGGPGVAYGKPVHSEPALESDVAQGLKAESSVPDKPLVEPTLVASEPTNLLPPLPNDLNSLSEMASGCQRCQLCESRRNVVFSDGRSDASIMVVGEAPGADEDASGLPFVGQAGQLLERMLAAIDCSRKTNVYIANVVKCRPPQNRDPNADEISKCIHFLHQQILLVKPKVIVLVGKIAISSLLGTNSKVSDVRGKVHQLTFNGLAIQAVATYHPAYLLRSPSHKSAAWDDLLLVKKLVSG